MKQLQFCFLFICINVYANAQNVGIGTITPSRKFTVRQDGIGITQENATGAVQVGFYTSSSYGFLQTHTNHPLGFATNNGMIQMLLSTDGNFGIGNATPTLAGLTVDKKVGAVNALFGSNASGVAIESGFPGIGLNTYLNSTRKSMAGGYGGWVGLNPLNGDLYIQSAATNGTVGNDIALTTRFLIDKNGLVGIGATPTEKLHVDGGNMRLGNAVWSTTGNDRLLKFGDGDYVSIGEAGADDRMQLTASNFYFTKSSGSAYVGINNPAPAYNMDITGSLRATDAGIIGGSLSVGGNSTVNGTLKIAGGSPGNGKVLTSDATGNATWKTQAYGNTERFMLRDEKSLFSAEAFTIDYNLGTAAINTNNGEITVNKTGLYQIEVSYHVWTGSDFSINGSTPRTVSLSLKVGSKYYSIKGGQPFFKDRIPNLPSYSDGSSANPSNQIQIYLTAGTIIDTYLNVPDEPSGNTLFFNGYISGNLIAE